MYTFSRQISQRLLELGIDIPDCNVCNGAKKVWKDKWVICISVRVFIVKQ